DDDDAEKSADRGAAPGAGTTDRHAARDARRQDPGLPQVQGGQSGLTALLRVRAARTAVMTPSFTQGRAPQQPSPGARDAPAIAAVDGAAAAGMRVYTTP